MGIVFGQYVLYSASYVWYFSTRISMYGSADPTWHQFITEATVSRSSNNWYFFCRGPGRGPGSLSRLSGSCTCIRVTTGTRWCGCRFPHLSLWTGQTYLYNWDGEGRCRSFQRLCGMGLVARRLCSRVPIFNKRQQSNVFATSATCSHRLSNCAFAVCNSSWLLFVESPSVALHGVATNFRTPPMRDITRRRLSLSFVRRLSSFLLFLSSFFALFNSSSNSSTWCCSAEFCLLKPSACCLKSHIVLLYESDCEWSELLGELAAFGGTLSERSISVRLWSSITWLDCVACCICIDSFIEALSLSLLFFFFSSRFCLRWVLLVRFCLALNAWLLDFLGACWAHCRLLLAPTLEWHDSDWLIGCPVRRSAGAGVPRKLEIDGWAILINPSNREVYDAPVGQLSHKSVPKVPTL